MSEEIIQPQKRGLSAGSIVLLVSLVVAVVVIGLALVKQNQTQPTDGAAPDFSLTTFDGEEVRLSDFQGQVVVLNFWASWCGPCRQEAPELVATWEAYRDKGVVFIGVAYLEDSEASALAFIEEFGAYYINGFDYGTRIGRLYNVQGVPETFIIDQNGEIQYFYMQPLTYQTLARVLDDLLAKGETAS